MTLRALPDLRALLDATGAICPTRPSLVLDFIITVTYFSDGDRRGLVPSSEGRGGVQRQDTAHTSSSSPPKSGPLEAQGPQIYVTVSRRHPRQDRPARLRRPAQRCHRRAARYAAADRQQVAPALLRRTLGRLGGRAS